MSKMSKQQKQIAIVAAAALGLYLLYRWYSSRQTAGASGGIAPNTAGADYAGLAGQEQGDVAALQGQNAQLLGQEQSDVAALTGALGGLTGQEQSDVSGLTGALGNLQSRFDSLLNTPVADNTAAVATGTTKVSRTNIATHKGGPFYNYYLKVTGHPPPATLEASNWVYAAWKQGVKVTRLQKQHPHPSAPRQHHVAHPNPGHQQQSNVHHKLPRPHPPHPHPVTRVSGHRHGIAPHPEPTPKPPPKPRPRPRRHRRHHA